MEVELSDAASETMFKKIDGNGTVVGIILNNASLQIGYITDYLHTPIEDFPISFAVNTIAPMQICYHFPSRHD